MRAKLVTLALALAIGASSGCAWPDQRVRLQPTIPFPPVPNGGRRAVELRVTDQRPRGEIGRRIGPGVGGAITTDQDLELLVRNLFADALERDGFTVASSGTGEAVLDVALRNFEYEVARNGWSLSIRAWAALDARCERGARGYEKFYREQHVRSRRSFPLEPESNEALLYETLSGALRQPFADRALLDCLVGSQSPPTDSSAPPDQTP